MKKATTSLVDLFTGQKTRHSFSLSIDHNMAFIQYMPARPPTSSRVINSRPALHNDQNINKQNELWVLESIISNRYVKIHLEDTNNGPHAQMI